MQTIHRYFAFCFGLLLTLAAHAERPATDGAVYVGLTFGHTTDSPQDVFGGNQNFSAGWMLGHSFNPHLALEYFAFSSHMGSNIANSIAGTPYPGSHDGIALLGSVPLFGEELFLMGSVGIGKTRIHVDGFGNYYLLSENNGGFGARVPLGSRWSLRVMKTYLSESKLINTWVGFERRF